MSIFSRFRPSPPPYPRMTAEGRVYWARTKEERGPHSISALLRCFSLLFLLLLNPLAPLSRGGGQHSTQTREAPWAKGLPYVRPVVVRFPWRDERGGRHPNTQRGPILALLTWEEHAGPSQRLASFSRLKAELALNTPGDAGRSAEC